MARGRVGELLPAVEEDLRRFVRRHAGRVARLESVDDLVQAIHLRALEHGTECEFPAREAFLAWLYRVAASHLADRRSYWRALRRRPERLLRLTRGGSETGAGGAAREPPSTATGASTLASRADEWALAVRALALLLPRDRSLVEWATDDVPADEQAQRLGLTADAVRQCRHRAFARFRAAHAVVRRGRRSGAQPG